jgi:hypothetical protein
VLFRLIACAGSELLISSQLFIFFFFFFGVVVESFSFDYFCFWPSSQLSFMVNDVFGRLGWPGGLRDWYRLSSFGW